jgi:translation initiation factor IF-2
VPAFGTFGAARGSGLARGKRPAQNSASATAAPGSYKPTSIEVIAPQTEYKNPFTGETTVNAPRANEPAPQAAPTPAPAPLPAPTISEPAAAAPTATPVPESSASLDASSKEDTADKPELKILPPEQPKRAAVRWEASQGEPAAGAPAADNRRDERPTFRPDRERREGREGRDFRENRESREGREPREGRDPRENREGRDSRGFRENRERGEQRRDDRRSEPRQNQPQEQRPQPQPEAKSGGFIGWLKGLFGGKPAETPTTETSGGNEPRRDREDGFRHRHRGGRGRGGQGGGYQGDNRGPRPEGQQGGFQGGEPRGEGDFGGRRRRRRRGGRGRNHGDPRPEGQQGGGAI